MNTPWGISDNSRQFEAGIGEVSTPSHGGIYVSLKYADNLSEAAKKKGINQGGYLFYEEDCDWMIPAWEFLHLLPLFFKHSRTPPSEWSNELLEGLSYWNLSYALEVGIVPLDALPKRYFCPKCCKGGDLHTTPAGSVVCSCGYCFKHANPPALPSRKLSRRYYHVLPSGRPVPDREEVYHV